MKVILDATLGCGILSYLKFPDKVVVVEKLRFGLDYRQLYEFPWILNGLWWGCDHALYLLSYSDIFWCYLGDSCWRKDKSPHIKNYPWQKTYYQL